MHRWLLVIFLAGCFGIEEPNLMAHEDMPIAMYAPVESCDGVSLVLPLEPEYTDAYLPVGYRPRDASGLFGAPAQSGLTAMFLADFACGPEAENRVAYTAIFVERPQIATHLPPVAYEFFMLELVTNEGSFSEALAKFQWPVGIADLNLTIDAVSSPTLQTDPIPLYGHASVNVADQQNYTFSTTTGAFIGNQTPEVGYESWNLRLWQEEEHHSMAWHLNFTEDIVVGVGSCQFEPESWPYRVSQVSSCGFGGVIGVDLSADDAYGVIFTNVSPISNLLRVAHSQNH